MLTRSNADMSSKTNSGVQGLRAMFEQSNNETSPPSRGRSPAGDSTTGSTSRPISKVRASFVSVDRSGPGLLPALRKTDTNESRPSMDGMQDEKPLDGSLDGQKSDGEKTVSVPDKKISRSTPAGETAPYAQTSEKKSIEPGQESTGNPDKATTAVEEAPSELLPGDPSNAAAVSGGEALGSDAPDLGFILKGSPFVDESNLKQAHEGKNEHVGSDTKAKPSSIQPEKAPPKAQSNTHSSAKVKGQSSITPKTTSKSPVGTDSSSAEKPSATKAERSPKQPQSPKTASNDKQDTKTKRETAGQASTKPSKPISITSQPNTRKVPTRAPDEASNIPSTKSTRPVRLSNHSPATNSNPQPKNVAKAPANTNASKPSSSGPPKSTFIKPRPKSPTKPARLPASATAPTAASAAKLDGEGPKAPAISTAAKPKANINQTKPPRASLPARSIPAPEKPKRSQPRASMASATSKPAEGGFLARMMRPTQASKSKTHDKVEVKSPPRSSTNNTAKPKKVSKESEKGLGEDVASAPAEVPEEAPPAEGVSEEIKVEGRVSNGEHQPLEGKVVDVPQQQPVEPVQ